MQQGDEKHSRANRYRKPVIFCVWKKHIIGDFVGFQGGLDLTLRCVQDNQGVKKVFFPQKTPKKITSHTIRIGGALIVNNLLHFVLAILKYTSKNYTSFSRRKTKHADGKAKILLLVTAKRFSCLSYAQIAHPTHG